MNSRQSQSKNNKFTHKKIKFEYMLKLYSVVGVAVSILGFLYLLMTLLPSDLTRTQYLAISLVCAGTTMAILPIFLKKMIAIKERKDLMDNASFYIFLELFSHFEKAAKISLTDSGFDGGTLSFKSIVQGLVNESKIDRNDVSILFKILKLRNSIVHNELGDYQENFDDLEKMINEQIANLIKIIDKL